MLTDLSSSHPGLLAITDRLTGLYNRSAFDEHFSLAIASGHVFSLALLDIDQFKSYEEAFGEVAANEVLKQIARIMAHHLRAGDVLARYAGDEFIILLPQTPAPTALSIAERLRKQVAQSVWPLRQITISCGVTTRLPGEQIQERDKAALADAIIRRTDKALQRAKESGRNRAIHTDSLSAALSFDPGQAPYLLAELQSQAKKLRHEDLDQAIAAARQAVEIAAACDQKEAQAQMAWAQSLAGLGELFGQKGDYFQALQNLLHALDLVKAAPAWPLHGEILRETITVYTNLGEFPTALRYCLELNALAKGQGDFGWRATAFNWIAHVLMRMKNWRQAADYLERGLKVVDGHTDFESQAMLHINLCSSYTALGEHYLAVQSGQRGLALAQDAGHIQLEAESLYTLSQAYLAQGSHEQALDCFNECLAFCQANQLRAEMLRCQQGIAAIFEQSDRPAEALQQLEQALRLAEECGPKSAQYQVHRQMAEIYKALGQPEAALHHFEQFYLLYQAAQSEAVELRVKNLQAVHELAISRQEADLQRQKNLELQNLLDQQELLIDDLNAFAHTVAHDLKTPIAALSLSIELLGRVENSHLSQQGLEILNSASLASQRMNTITDELLILASVREQSIELQALDMAEIVTRVESRLQMMIAGQQARLVKPEQWPAALGYAPWIEEVWANYISNAIKYGGHPPQVRLGGDLLPGKQVQFWVCDNGKGLKAEEMRLLFQPFQRLSQVQTQGYGLGLPIVRRILEKLGGEVGVESQGIPGEGCKFTFILPAAPE